MKKWQIDYYSTSSGREPVQLFIDNLPRKAKSRVYYALELLAEFGPQLTLPHTKKVASTPLWELRILGTKHLRSFYIAKVGKSFLILHAFIKKSQHTPRKEIKTALKRLRDFQSRP
ncbi:type II toxin-antitoxin system RelE/ParE family toxin [Patescibacteria group bacterium]